MKSLLSAIPLLLAVCFLVMSSVSGVRFIDKAGMDGASGKPFRAREARRSALITGLYVTLALISLSTLGLFPDAGANRLSATFCFGAFAIPLGIIAAIGSYGKAKSAFEGWQHLAKKRQN